VINSKRITVLQVLMNGHGLQGARNLLGNG